MDVSKCSDGRVCFRCFCLEGLTLHAWFCHSWIFKEHHHCVKQFGSRSGLTFLGSKLIAKVISRWQKSPLAGKKLNIFYKVPHENYIFLITKTRLYNFDPRKPHLYVVKLGFTGEYIIFLISVQNIDCGYSLEQPHRGHSNEYPQSMFWADIWKNIRVFYLKIFSFWRWNFLYICIGVFS